MLEPSDDFAISELGIPNWVIRKLLVAETVMRCELRANHVKTLYWSHYGKTHEWIARNPFGDQITLGTVKNLMSQTIKALKQTEEVGPKAQSLHLFKEAMFLILDEMIFHKPENIDLHWPPPMRMAWVYHLAQDRKFYVRFSMCYDYQPTNWVNIDGLV
jgi:hypothetical protein